jgi:hypothetical protein
MRSFISVAALAAVFVGVVAADGHPRLSGPENQETGTYNDI